MMPSHAACSKGHKKKKNGEGQHLWNVSLLGRAYFNIS